MKNAIKFYGIPMMCLLLIICFACVLLSTKISAKAENIEKEECSQDCLCDNYYENIEEKYDYVYIDYNGKHILQNQSFVIPFIINSGSNILDYSFEQTGFTVLASSIINEKQVDFELSCIPDSSEYRLSVQITLKTKKIITGNLYAVANESGVFISQFSKDNAYENYFEYALQNKLLTEDEVSTLTQQNYSSSVTVKSSNVKGLDPDFLQPITEQTLLLNGQSPVKYNSNAKSGVDTYLQGTLEWEDDLGQIHPLRRVMVEIYDYDGILPDYHLGTVYTDYWGNYSFAFENNDGFGENGGYDLYIRAYAGDNNAMVDKNLVGTKYWWESGHQDHMNVSTGTTSDIDMLVDMTSDLGRAFQISQAILTARDFAWSMTGIKPPDVSVRYPDGDIDYYDSSLSRIHITGNAHAQGNFPNSYASWDAIMHEYGHHIQYDQNIEDSPCGWHAINANMVDHYAGTDHGINTCNGECARPSAAQAKYEGIRIAWAEAWPTVFGTLAQYYYSLDGIVTAHDTSYTAYNGVDENFDTVISSTLRRGDGCEFSLIAVLWDLYDDGTEIFDTIALEYESWWDVTTDGECKTFSEFIQYFYSSYPQLIDDIGANLSHYKIASSGVIAPSSSELTSTPPTFSWNAQGGSTHFPNNYV